MNSLVPIALLSALSLASFAADPAKPAADAKLTPQDFRVFPFAQENNNVKFKAGSHEFPDELTVTKTDKIHIYGKKKTGNVVGVRGGGAANFGKLVLMPPGQRQGRLLLKTSSGPNFYFASLELPDDELKSAELHLKEGKAYAWSAKTENGKTTLRVFGGDGIELGSASASSDQVLGLGFAATARGPGNEVDLTVTVE